MTSCRKCLNGALAKQGLPRDRRLLHCAVAKCSFRGRTMIVNLNQYRKKRRRAEAELRVKESRVRFGRSKEECLRERRERERETKEIEDKRLD
jgi:uncharacterized protein DUF4169